MHCMPWPVRGRRTQQIHNKMPPNNRSRLVHLLLVVTVLANGVSRINAVPTNDGAGVVSTALHAPVHHALRRDVATMTASLMQEESKDATATEAALDQQQQQQQQQQSQPQPQPQGQCLFDGTLVAETSVVCKERVGCRAVLKTGHCCPDYKCDCQKDGKAYLNGDKLVDPDTPCTVCYCKGGEILCSSVSCFQRDDCTPKFVPGRCCPEYDNCPVASSESKIGANSTASSTPAPNFRPEPPAPALNQKITIKEITKPTEIRITDDNKAIPIHQMLAPSTSTTTTTTTGQPSTTTSTAATSSTTMLPTTTTTNVWNRVPPNSHDKSPKVEEGILVPQNSVEQQSSVGNALQHLESESVNDTSKVNIKREFSFATESATSLVGVPVDEYNTSELIYANSEPLQQDASAGFRQNSADLEPDTAGSDNIYHIILTTDGPAKLGTSQILLAESSSTTEGVDLLDTSNDGTWSLGSTESPIPLQSPTQSNSEKIRDLGKSVDKTLKGHSTTGPDQASSTESNKGVHHLEEEEIATPMESNPAYPSLPEDDFSLRDVNFPLSETDDVGEVDIKDEPRSISVPPASDALKSTKQLEEHIADSVEGSASGMSLELEASSTSNYNAMSSTSEGLGRVQLMYSAEDVSAETTISNSSDFQLEKIMNEGENETGSGESLELDSLEVLMSNESGSGEPENTTEQKHMKQREPTTPRPTAKSDKQLDIDELGMSGDAALGEDPKLDVESLKLDENQADGAGIADTVSKNDVLSVKTYPAQDKAVEDPVVNLMETKESLA